MLKALISFTVIEVLVLVLGLKLRGFWLWLVIGLFILFLIPLPYLGWLRNGARQPGFWTAALLVRPVFAWHFNWAVFVFFFGLPIVLLRIIASIGGWEKIISGMRFVVLGLALFWGAVSIVGLIGSLRMPKVETLELKIPGLRAKDDGLRLVQLSDLHFSWWNSQREFFRMAEKIKELKPDLLVLTGDLVDHNPEYASTLGDLLKEIQPPLGTYAIIGNHDVYTGADVIAGQMEEKGIRMLRREFVDLSAKGADLVIVGMEDSGEHWTSPDPAEADLPKLIKQVSGGLPIILLTHRPSGFERVKGLPVGLTLSGHTHGGQLNLPFGGPGLANLGGFKRISGLFQENGQMLYVSRGIGTVGWPFRINSPPEITLIILRSSELTHR